MNDHKKKQMCDNVMIFVIACFLIMFMVWLWIRAANGHDIKLLELKVQEQLRHQDLIENGE